MKIFVNNNTIISLENVRRVEKNVSENNSIVITYTDNEKETLNFKDELIMRAAFIKIASILEKE